MSSRLTFLGYMNGYNKVEHCKLSKIIKCGKQLDFAKIIDFSTILISQEFVN